MTSVWETIVWIIIIDKNREKNIMEIVKLKFLTFYSATGSFQLKHLLLVAMVFATFPEEFNLHQQFCLGTYKYSTKVHL